MRNDPDLLDALVRVIDRLLGERRVNYQMLAELEDMRDELERELVSQPPGQPPDRAPDRHHPPPPPPPTNPPPPRRR